MQKGLFDAIKENLNFPNCRGILHTYRQWHFFAIARFKPFSCPFPLLFLASSTFATFCISYPFGLLQKVGCWLNTKPSTGTLISYRSNGPFYEHFCTKTNNVDFQVATSQCHQNPKTSVVQIDLSSLNHLPIKNVQWHLNWWCQKWYKEHNH